MVVNLSIPDDLYSAYVKMNPQNPGKAMVKQLARFKEVTPGRRALVLSGDDLTELQRLADKSLETAEDIRKLVEDSLYVREEGVKIRFTEGQRNRLRQDAQFWQKDPGVFASEALQQLIDARFGA